MQPIRILFLDVDGVLNCRECLLKRSSEFIPGVSDLSMDHVRVLGELVYRASVEIVVLSSTWRMAGEGEDRMRNLRSALRKVEVEIHSKTPTSVDSIRGDEIERWLVNNGVIDRPYKMVILDDDSDMLEWQRPYLVQTYFDTGLTMEKVEEALRVFEGDPVGD